jgi:hypothetical protein
LNGATDGSFVGFLRPGIYGKLTSLLADILALGQFHDMLRLPFAALTDKYTTTTATDVLWFVPNQFHLTIQPHFRYYAFRGTTPQAQRLLAKDARTQLFSDIATIFFLSGRNVYELHYW